MEIVDAQIHEPLSAAPWPYGEDSQLVLACELAREAMDSVGVDVALPNARQEFLDVAVSLYPDRFAGCGIADPIALDVEDFVAGYRNRPGMLALRIILRRGTTGELFQHFVDGRCETFFAAAENHGLPLFVQAAGHLATLYPVIEAHPNLTMVLDHLGLNQHPAIVADDPWEYLPQVLTMARYPNIHVKFCGAVTFSRRPYPHDDLWPHLIRMVEAFGPERLMWGSDFTRLRFAPRSVERGPKEGWFGLYSDSVNFLRDTTEVSQSDKEQIFAGAIRRVLQWPKAEEIARGFHGES